MKTSLVLLSLSLALSAFAAPQTPHNEVRGGHFGGGHNNSGNRNNNNGGKNNSNNGGGNNNNNQNTGVCLLNVLQSSCH